MSTENPTSALSIPFAASILAFAMMVTFTSGWMQVWAVVPLLACLALLNRLIGGVDPPANLRRPRNRLDEAARQADDE